MARKLKVELDVDANEAQEKLAQSLPQQISGSTANSEAMRSNDRLTKATELSANRMLTMTRAFTGMAAGLAASYASRYFERGSTEEKAFAYGGSILSGASAGATMGMAAGPQGAAIGAAAGGVMGWLKEFFDRDKEKADLTEDYVKSESAYAADRRFANDMKRITSPYNPEPLDVKLGTLADQYEFYTQGITTLKGLIEEALNAGEIDRVKELRNMLARVRSRKDTIYGLAEKLETSRPEQSVDSRAALSALQKIGGGAQPYQPTANGEVVVVLRSEMSHVTDLLKEINHNLGKDKSKESYL